MKTSRGGAGAITPLLMCGATCADARGAEAPPECQYGFGVGIDMYSGGGATCASRGLRDE